MLAESRAEYADRILYESNRDALATTSVRGVLSAAVIFLAFSRDEMLSRVNPVERLGLERSAREAWTHLRAIADLIGAEHSAVDMAPGEMASLGGAMFESMVSQCNGDLPWIASAGLSMLRVLVVRMQSEIVSQHAHAFAVAFAPVVDSHTVVNRRAGRA